MTKLFLIFITLFVLTKANGQNISLSVKNGSLQSIFKEIEKQSEYRFFYNETIIAKATRVSIDVKNSSIEDVLELCFKDQPLTYKIIDNTIVVTLKNEAKKVDVGPTSPALMDVTGVVKNETGQAIAGATVSVKGSNNKTATNDGGFFTIRNASANATLVITGVNIETYEVNVNGKNNFVINAKTKVTTDVEVKVTAINTGYQKIKPQEFVGAVSRLDSVSFARREGMGILERLDGTLPGLVFDKKNGGVRNPIQIRGINTLGRSYYYRRNRIV